MKSSGKKRKTQMRKIWLLNDMLIVATERGSNSFNFKESISVGSIIVRDLPDGDITSISHFKFRNSNFSDGVEVMNVETKKSLSLYYRNAAEKKQWLDQLNLLIEEYTAKYNDPTLRQTKQMMLAEWK
jgi:hypothetical protein